MFRFCLLETIAIPALHGQFCNSATREEQWREMKSLVALSFSLPEPSERNTLVSSTPGWMLLQLKQINEIKNEALLKWNTKQIQLLEDLDNG